MRSAALLIVAALANGGASPTHAAVAAPVTLPLKLGFYESPQCGQTYDVGGPLHLGKKGYSEDGDVTFVAVTLMGQNRYRVRTSSYDESNHRHYFWEVWQILNATSFTRVGIGWSDPSAHTYRYCGPNEPAG